jgi:hypothetical protein
MSNNHFKEKDMSLKAKGLLSLMLSLPDDWNYSVSGLVRLSKDGKDGVMSALGELESFRYLERIRTTDKKGRFSGIEYHIYEIPQPEKPIADNPISVKQNEEKANAEKPPQLNTNKLNTFELNIELLNTKVKNNTLRNLYIDYIHMRDTINSPITQRGLATLIDRVDRLSVFNVSKAKKLLETAIINNWKNVYLPTDEEETEVINPELTELKRFYMGDDEE